jgi:hypothetical protein
VASCNRYKIVGNGSTVNHSPKFKGGIIIPIEREKETESETDSSQSARREQLLISLRRKRNLQIVGKPKPPPTRNLIRLKQILKDEGFKIRGDRLLITREEGTFEVDLKMGHVFVLRKDAEPISLCVTLESSSWSSVGDLSDFDLFLLSVVYLLTNEELPECILSQLPSTQQ